MSTWYTSDLHLSHIRIIDLCDRPFADVDEMNEALTANWNAVVRPGDEVWILGDICMGQSVQSLPLLRRLNGTKLAVLGNHDKPSLSSGNKPVFRAKWSQIYTEHGLHIVSDGPAVRHQIGAHSVLLSHFPFESDLRHGDQHAEHLTADDGTSWLIHGHVHGTWRVNGRQINVGVDVNQYAPVSEAEILAIIER